MQSLQTASPAEVAEHIWKNRRDELEHSGKLLYTWQYDLRWAAMTLRGMGKLKPAERGKPWEIVS
jgi:hypothetical protein